MYGSIIKSNLQESDHTNFKNALIIQVRNMIPRKFKALAQIPKATI